MRRFLAGLICGFTLAVGGTAVAEVYATVDTNGILKGYTVQSGGRTICKDPQVWNDFRGQGNFIVCPD